MKTRLPTLALLAAAFVSTSALAQSAAAPASAASAAVSAVDPASIQALKDMGAYLQTLKRFKVETEHTGEVVLADGQKLMHSSSAELDVERPNKIRVVTNSARMKRELTYDGKTVTLYTPTQKYYSKVEFSGTLGELIQEMESRYGVEVPLSDLFLWGTPAAPLDKIESAMYAGQDLIDDELANHYAFRQGQFDWQIWIAADGKPLPLKLVITNRGDEARPQSVSQIEWSLKPDFKDSVFTFKPPKGSQEIKIVPLKTQ